MAGYILIESRDAFESTGVGEVQALAAQLAAAKQPVTLFLVQNGVLTARAGAHAEALAELQRAGVEVLADAFSLRERGIPEARLAEGVKAAPLDVVIDHLSEGRKALWS